jgi:small basic protein
VYLAAGLSLMSLCVHYYHVQCHEVFDPYVSAALLATADAVFVCRRPFSYYKAYTPVEKKDFRL